jgi:hypothetical protein
MVCAETLAVSSKAVGIKTFILSAVSYCAKVVTAQWRIFMDSSRCTCCQYPYRARSEVLHWQILLRSDAHANLVRDST